MSRKDARLYDGLLQAAFPPEGISSFERLEEHEEIRQEIGSLLLDNWEDADYVTPRGLRAAVNFACAPSTEHVIRSQTHTRDIAEEVAANLTDLSQHIVSTPGFSQGQVWERPNSRKIVGTLSETAILSSLWWGVAHGYYDESNYVLPVTAKQDASVIENGYHTGIDLIMRKSGERKRQLIQVKNSLASYERHSPYRVYRPDIAIMTPQLLLRDSSATVHTLLEVVAEDDTSLLMRANESAHVILEEAKSNASAYHSRMQVALA